MIPAGAIREAAREAGFTLAGLAPAAPLDPAPLRRWLAAGMAASMGWMARRQEERLDPSRVLPGARTVVALACCVLTREHHRPSPVAAYARGRDYHATMLDRLRALRRRLLLSHPALSTWHAVDTGAVLEREWARRAGLGWVGKNSMLVHPAHGSHLVLAVMVLAEEADAWDAPLPDRCGTCTACLEACPTRALVAPGVVDSRLCLSHQTIEDPGPYAPALREHAAGLAFGCDHCQAACPWNPPGHACDDPRFLPRPVASLSLEDLARLDGKRHAELTAGTAVARAGHAGLVRNALVALGAARQGASVARERLDDPDPAVAEAARWSAARP